MRRLILVFATVLAMLVFLEVDTVNAEEGHHSVGIEAGQVGLSGDVGSAYGNAIGIGGFFNYAASDYLEFELEYLNSHHNSNNINLSQNVFGLSLLYDIETYDIFTPYLRGGAEFVSHTQDFPLGGNTYTSSSTTGFGLDLGIGAKVDLGKNFMTGLDITYHNIFDVSYTPPTTGVSQKAIQSYYTVMLRFGFCFGGK